MSDFDKSTYLPEEMAEEIRGLKQYIRSSDQHGNNDDALYNELHERVASLASQLGQLQERVAAIASGSSSMHVTVTNDKVTLNGSGVSVSGEKLVMDGTSAGKLPELKMSVTGDNLLIEFDAGERSGTEVLFVSGEKLSIA